ncbi:MAG: transposase [Flavobacteriaceae bacterium]|nr:transposase [Flavobacteriaceae bacterium]
MKEDHMLSGQLKLGYTVRISSDYQFVIHYSIHQITKDIYTLKPHITSFEYQYETLTDYLTGDAGYGSEKNYDLLEQKGVEAYVKYNTFDKEQQTYKSKKKKKFKDDFYRVNLHYNLDKDCYICLMGQEIAKV